MQWLVQKWKWPAVKPKSFIQRACWRTIIQITWIMQIIINPISNTGWRPPANLRSYIRSGRITQSPPTYLRISERALPLDPARHSTTSTTLCRYPLSTLRSAQQIRLPRTSWLPVLGSRKPDRGPVMESPRESNIARSSDLCLTLAALSHSSWWVGCFLENYGIGFPFAWVEDSIFIRGADDVGVPVSGWSHR